MQRLSTNLRPTSVCGTSARVKCALCSKNTVTFLRSAGQKFIALLFADSARSERFQPRGLAALQSGRGPTGGSNLRIHCHAWPPQTVSWRPQRRAHTRAPYTHTHSQPAGVSTGRPRSILRRAYLLSATDSLPRVRSSFSGAQFIINQRNLRRPPKRGPNFSICRA